MNPENLIQAATKKHKKTKEFELHSFCLRRTV